MFSSLIANEVYLAAIQYEASNQETPLVNNHNNGFVLPLSGFVGAIKSTKPVLMQNIHCKFGMDNKKNYSKEILNLEFYRSKTTI